MSSDGLRAGSRPISCMPLVGRGPVVGEEPVQRTRRSDEISDGEDFPLSLRVQLLFCLILVTVSGKVHDGDLPRTTKHRPACLAAYGHLAIDSAHSSTLSINQLPRQYDMSSPALNSSKQYKHSVMVSLSPHL